MKNSIKINKTRAFSTHASSTIAYALLAACSFLGCLYSVAASGSVGDPPAEVGSQPTSTGAPAVFVIDSSNALRSFDANGNPLQQMHFRAELGNLNGGMTLAMGLIYVTWAAHPGGEGGGVFAFDPRTLRQVRLHIGAFTVDAAGGPGELHAIAFDAHQNHFYVATDRLGLLVFDSFGRYLPRVSPSPSPVTAVAYDSSQHSLWAIVGRHTVAQFGEDNGTRLPGLPAKGAPYRQGRGALAVAYCNGNENGSSPKAIAVAFGDAKAGSHVPGAGQSYDTAGNPFGSPYGGKIVNPHGMSCSSRGEVFIAADNGLLGYTLQGAVLSPPGELGGLNSPVYGVIAAY